MFRNSTKGFLPTLGVAAVSTQNSLQKSCWRFSKGQVNIPYEIELKCSRNMAVSKSQKLSLQGTARV